MNEKFNENAKVDNIVFSGIFAFWTHISVQMNQFIQNAMKCFSIKNVVNAKLSETQILRELSMLFMNSLIQIEISLIQRDSSLIEFVSSLLELNISLFELESSIRDLSYTIKELSYCIQELFNFIREFSI